MDSRKCQTAAVSPAEPGVYPLLIIQFAPNHGANIEAVIRAVEVIPLLVLAIVNNHVKTAGHGDNQLMQALVRMPAALSPAGYVIQVINPLYLKGNMCPALDKGQIAARVVDFGEVYYFTVDN